MSIYKQLKLYGVYCVTDNKWEYLWSTDKLTVCPTNNSHFIKFSSIEKTIKCEYNKDSTVKINYSSPIIADTSISNKYILLPDLVYVDDLVVIICRISSLNNCYIVGYNNQTVNNTSNPYSLPQTNGGNLILKKNTETNWEIVNRNSCLSITDLEKKIDNIPVKQLIRENVLTSSTTLSTTSNTFIDISGITKTVTENGKYLIMINLLLTNSKKSEYNFIVLNINNVDIDATIKSVPGNLTNIYDQSILYYTTELDVNTVIKARWRVSTTTASTCTISFRSFILIQL